MQCRRATLRQMVTQILTWQHLLIRARPNLRIDLRVPGCADAAGQEVGFIRGSGEIFTAGNGDGAEPGFVGVGAVVAVAGEGVLG